MRKIHISDSNSKNTFVHFSPIKAPANPNRSFGKEKVFSRRLLLSGDVAFLFSESPARLTGVLKAAFLQKNVPVFGSSPRLTGVLKAIFCRKNAPHILGSPDV